MNDIFGGDSDIYNFIISDPVAFAKDAIEKNKDLNYNIKSMLIGRLRLLSGEPYAVVPREKYVIMFYSTSEKADIADLAARIYKKQDETLGRDKSLDYEGHFAVKVK